MPKVHLVLQGKGGVGKTFVAAALAQYLAEKSNKKPLCLDTDPVNASFAGYESLGVRRIEIMQGDEIDPRSFDKLVEMIAASKEDVVVDNGASSFVPLVHYLLSNGVPALLAAHGYETVLHTVITGGQALVDTVNGFDQLADQFPAPTSIVTWINPFFGSIEHDGKQFESFAVYLKHKNRVTAMIRIPAWKAETFGHDLRQMLQQHQTFAEAINDENGAIMVRQRLKMARDQLFQQIATAAIL